VGYETDNKENQQMSKDQRPISRPQEINKRAISIISGHKMLRYLGTPPDLLNVTMKLIR